MQTILGSTGQIGTELIKADLLDAEQTRRAVEGGEVVYLTAGLPMDTQRWVEQWPAIMRNVIVACETHKAKLVFFDNTYMYPQTSAVQTEETVFKPYGLQGKVRAEINHQLLLAMQQGRVNALICRAPEFYGPGLTQSITNSTIINALKQGKKARVFVRDDTLRTLIYTPDASRAMALLGNMPDAYGQTWHLPCDDNRLTYREFVQLAAKTMRVPALYTVLKKWQLRAAGLFNQQVRDAAELLPRYEADNIFDSSKFQQRFPDFQITRIADGLRQIASEK